MKINRRYQSQIFSTKSTYNVLSSVVSDLCYTVVVFSTVKTLGIISVHLCVFKAMLQN